MGIMEKRENNKLRKNYLLLSKGASYMNVKINENNYNGSALYEKSKFRRY